MDSCGLYALALHNPDLLFSQPVKLVDQGVYLAVSGHYLALDLWQPFGSHVYKKKKIAGRSTPSSSQ